VYSRLIMTADVITANRICSVDIRVVIDGSGVAGVMLG